MEVYTKSGLYGAAAYIDLKMFISFLISLIRASLWRRLLLIFHTPGALSSVDIIRVQGIFFNGGQ